MSAVQAGGKRYSTRRTGLLVVAMVPFVYPFLYLLSTSLKSSGDFSAHPNAVAAHPTLGSYSRAWEGGNLGDGMLHSTVAVAVAVVLTVLVSMGGAFWFMRHTGRAARALRAALVAMMAVPPPVFVIPLFVLLADYGLVDNLFALGAVYAAWNASFGLYLMHAYYASGIPREVLEAAEVDGATVWRQFVHIVVPLSRSAVATLATLTFMWSWGDLLLSVILVQDPALRTLMPSAALLADQFNTDIPANAAATVVALLPMLLVFLFGQRFLQRGVLAGMGK